MAVRGENSLYFATLLDNSGLRQGKLEAVGIIQSLGATISKINPFAALAVGATAIFAGIANEAFRFAKQYEQAMKEVETISKATQQDFNGIRDEIFSISQDTLDDPVKLAKAYYQIVSAGQDGAEAMKVLEVASKAAVAGVTDTQTAADGITTIMNAFGLAVEDADGIADSMFKTVELGKTTFSELARNIAQAAPIAASAGVQYNEILAAVASLTKQGVPTNQAFTQIKASIVGANKALGDGWAEAYTYQEALDEIYQRADGSQTKMQEMVGSVEAVSAVLGVAGKNAEGAASDFDKITNSSGAASEAFGRMASSNINQWTIFGNRVRAVTQRLGEFVLDASSGLATTLNFLTKDFNSVSKAMEKQQLELLQLQIELNNTNTSAERRLELIEQLKTSYPDYIGQIDAEKISSEELNKVLEEINTNLINRIAIQKQQEEIDKVNERAGILALDQVKSQKQLLEEVAKRAQQYGLEIDNTLEPLAQARDIAKQLIDGDSANGERSIYGVSLGEMVGELENITANLNAAKKEAEDLTKTKIDLQATFKVNGVDDGVKVIKETEAEALAKIEAATNRFQLSEYLVSENEKIKQAAEDRLEIIKSLLGGDGGKTDIEAYKEQLDKRREDYDNYATVVSQLGQEIADKEYASLLKQGQDYGEYLSKQLQATKDFAKQRAIALAADDYGIDLNREVLEKVDVEPRTVNLNVDIDTTSLDAINKKLSLLYEEFDAARTESDQRHLAAKIEVLNQEKEEIEALLDDTKMGYEDLFKSIEDLNLKDLNDRLRTQKNTLAALLKNEKKNAQEISKVRSDISQTEEAIGSKLESTFQNISGIFSGLSDIFSKFGNEDMAQLTDQLSGVASAAGTLSKGIATGDPFAIAQGVIDIASSALTVEIVSDTSKFEAAIDDLQRAIDQLDYAISQSIGDERISNRQDAIDQLAELEEQAQLAEEAERKARKEVKLLGIKVGDKGEGSGTSVEKIEELQDEAEEARQKIEELNQEIREIFTGTTQETIVDSIVNGLEQGKRSLADFAGTFEDLMKEAMLESLKIKFLEKSVSAFFEDFADASESGGGLTATEINQLRSTFGNILDQSNKELDALNEILGTAGVTAIGTDTEEAQGATGAIQTMTEDSASVISGIWNAIRLDVRNSLEVSREMSEYLSNIDIGIQELNAKMETANTRLFNIDRSLS